MAIIWKDGKTEYEGAVLECPIFFDRRGDYESIGALVWNGERTEQIAIGTVSYGNAWSDIQAVKVDATEETKAAVAAWKERKAELEKQNRELQERWEKATSLHQCNVRVIAGRKLPKGSTQFVEYAFEGTHGPCAKISDGTRKGVLVSAENLAILPTPQLIALAKELIDRWNSTAASLPWLNGSRPPYSANHYVWDEKNQHGTTDILAIAAIELKETI